MVLAMAVMIQIQPLESILFRIIYHRVLCLSTFISAASYVQALSYIQNSNHILHKASCFILHSKLEPYPSRLHASPIQCLISSSILGSKINRRIPLVKLFNNDESRMTYSMFFLFCSFFQLCTTWFVSQSIFCFLQGVRREVGIHAKAFNKAFFRNQINSVPSSNELDVLTDSIQEKLSSDAESSAPRLQEESSTFQQKSKNATLLLKPDERRVSSSNFTPLKEQVGHTEVEVIAGALLGFIISLTVSLA